MSTCTRGRRRGSTAAICNSHGAKRQRLNEEEEIQDIDDIEEIQDVEDKEVEEEVEDIQHVEDVEDDEEKEEGEEEKENVINSLLDIHECPELAVLQKIFYANYWKQRMINYIDNDQLVSNKYLLLIIRSYIANKHITGSSLFHLYHERYNFFNFKSKPIEWTEKIQFKLYNSVRGSLRFGSKYYKSDTITLDRDGDNLCYGYWRFYYELLYRGELSMRFKPVTITFWIKYKDKKWIYQHTYNRRTYYNFELIKIPILRDHTKSIHFGPIYIYYNITLRSSGKFTIREKPQILNNPKIKQSIKLT